MTRRAARLIVAVASLGAAAAISVVPAVASSTTSATAASPTHVGIVVRLSDSSTATACVQQGGDGLDVLVRGFPNTEIPTSGPYAGFVVRINDVGQNPPDDTHYWSYWHATASGWKYSDAGGGSYTPKTGSVEGWSYVDGQGNAPKPPTYSYQKLCGSQDPQPTPTHTPPASHPPHSSPTRAVPTRHRSSRPHPSSAAPTTSASSSATTSSAAPPPKHRASTARSSAAHRVASSHAGPAPHPSTTPATAASTPSAPVRSAAAAPLPSPSLQPAAARRSAAGFPALGTLVAIVVVAALGGVAWLRLRRRPE